MSAKIKTLVGDHLVAKGIIDRDTLEKALKSQAGDPISSRRKIGDILVEEYGIDRHIVYQEIASIYGFKEFRLNGYRPDGEQIEFVRSLLEKLDKKDKDYIAKHRILPLKVHDAKKDVLVVLASDPTDRHIPNLALQFGFAKFDAQYASQEDIDTLIDGIAPNKNEFLTILEDMTSEEDMVADRDEGMDEEALDAEIHKSKLTSLIEACLVEAVHRKASDVHIIPREGNKVEIDFRIDGRLAMWHIQEGTKPEAISAVVKDRTRNVDRFERETAQDGFIQRNVDGYTIRYRVSILPIVGAEFERKMETIVIRVLDDRNVVTDLEKLGLQKKAKDDFLAAITRPQGIVILTGPTGSGKSTTLIAALHAVLDPSLNVLTVEDPVEYLIRGARQLKIGPKMNFDQALRSILRHDPDIVMLGEMRDGKTAEIAMKLANTGHLTFSTLHTNDAPSAISRLYKMGIEPFLIANAINIVIAQRLIRTLCPHCKQEKKDMNGLVLKTVGFTPEEAARTVFYEAVGCPECNCGYKGRVAIHEALLFTKEIRRMIFEASENIDEEAIRSHAVRNGMLSLRMSGRERIMQGITTCEEVIFATAED